MFSWITKSTEPKQIYRPGTVAYRKFMANRLIMIRRSGERLAKRKLKLALWLDRMLEECDKWD